MEERIRMSLVVWKIGNLYYNALLLYREHIESQKKSLLKKLETTSSKKRDYSYLENLAILFLYDDISIILIS